MDTAPTASLISAEYAWMYWVIAALVFVLVVFVTIVVRKGRLRAGPHVFRASRLSRGNRLLPAQVSITRDSITMFQPQWIGKIEESIHLAHVSSIKIDTNLVFSDVFIETTGGHNPIICHGHTKGDAVQMKRIIEQFQSERYARPAGES